MAAPLELFPCARVDPAGFARAQLEQFAGRQLRIGRSTVVHAVAWQPWLGDLALPVPACHQGWSGFAAAGDLLPSSYPPTCRKCAMRAQAPFPAMPAQQSLFDAAEDE